MSKRRYNNENYKNSGYNEKRYNNNFAPRTAGFDARKYKKQDIEITDLNGKTYIISGNFASTFSVEMVKYIEQVEKYKEEKADIKDMPEMVDMLKEWCLNLLNHNIDGKVYDMTVINAGFNDVDVLFNLFNYITNLINDYNDRTIHAKKVGD